jgi:hypothetical protein
MSLKTRIDKAVALAREREKAWHDRELAPFLEALNIASVADAYGTWLRRKTVAPLEPALCTAITRARAQSPEGLWLAFKIVERCKPEDDLSDYTHSEALATIAPYFHSHDSSTGNLAGLFYAIDPNAGNDPAALAVYDVLTPQEREIGMVILSTDKSPTQDEETRLWRAIHRLLPLVEAARDSMRGRGLCYDGNPPTLIPFASMASGATVEA